MVYGQYKGIPKQQIREKLAANTDVILRLDVQGAATVRDLMPDATFVFVAAARRRSRDDSRDAARRCPRGTRGRIRPTAREELARVGVFDYVVINEDDVLPRAERLAAVIANGGGAIAGGSPCEEGSRGVGHAPSRCEEETFRPARTLTGCT